MSAAAKVIPLRPDYHGSAQPDLADLPAHADHMAAMKQLLARAVRGPRSYAGRQPDAARGRVAAAAQEHERHKPPPAPPQLDPDAFISGRDRARRGRGRGRAAARRGGAGRRCHASGTARARAGRRRRHGTVRTRRRELADASAALTAAKAEHAAAERVLEQLQTRAADPKRQRQVQRLVELTARRVAGGVRQPVERGPGARARAGAELREVRQRNAGPAARRPLARGEARRASRAELGAPRPATRRTATDVRIRSPRDGGRASATAGGRRRRTPRHARRLERLMIQRMIGDGEAIDLTSGNHTITNAHVTSLHAVAGSGAVKLTTRGGAEMTIYLQQGETVDVDVATVVQEPARTRCSRARPATCWGWCGGSRWSDDAAHPRRGAALVRVRAPRPAWPRCTALSRRAAGQRGARRTARFSAPGRARRGRAAATCASFAAVAAGLAFPATRSRAWLLVGWGIGMRATRGRADVRFTRFASHTLGVTFTPGQRRSRASRSTATTRRTCRPRSGPAPRSCSADVETVPDNVRPVAVIIAGARSGKSWMSALRLLHLAVTVPLSLAAGEEASALAIAPDLRLARIVLRYALGAVKSVRSRPASWAAHSGRASGSGAGTGRWCGSRCCPPAGAAAPNAGARWSGACWTKAAFFRDAATGAINDSDIFGAVATRIVAGGQLILASTPWAEAGVTWELWRDNHGTPDTAMVAWAPTLAMRDDEHTRTVIARETRTRPRQRRTRVRRALSRGRRGRVLRRRRAAGRHGSGPLPGRAARARIIRGGGRGPGLVRDASAAVVVHRAGDVLHGRRGAGAPAREGPAARARRGVRAGSAGWRRSTVRGARWPTTTCSARPADTCRAASRSRRRREGIQGKAAAFTHARDLLRAGRLRIPAECEPARPAAARRGEPAAARWWAEHPAAAARRRSRRHCRGAGAGAARREARPVGRRLRANDAGPAQQLLGTAAAAAAVRSTRARDAARPAGRPRDDVTDTGVKNRQEAPSPFQRRVQRADHDGARADARGDPSRDFLASGFPFQRRGVGLGPATRPHRLCENHGVGGSRFVCPPGVERARRRRQARVRA